MSEWKEFKLKEITSKIGSGSTPTGGKDAYFDSGITLIRSLNIYDFVFSYKDLAFINEDQAKKLNGVTVHKKDILLNITGASVGRCTIVPEHLLPARVNQHVSIIRIRKEKVNPKFLLYCINSPAYKDMLLTISGSGATREALTKDDIENFKILLPELPIQQRIASILSAYDELIENNNHRIVLLERMAEQIYKEWFVRLRFPGWENVELKKGVPKGWEVKTVKDFGKIVTGKTPSTFNSRYFGGKYPFIKTPDMHEKMFILHTEESLTEDGFNSQKSQIISENSICVNCIGTGAGLVSITPSICMTNQQIHTLILKNQEELEFLFFVFRGLKPMIEMVGSTGATMTNVSKGKFENLKLIKPNDQIIKQYSLITKPMFNSIRILLEQQIILTQTRDLLLPRLISGKLRVKNAEMKL